MEVEVTCAAEPEQQAMVRDNVQLSLGTDARPYTLPTGRAGLVDRDVDRITVAWSEPAGAVVRPRVDPTYAEELDEIVAGIEIVNP
ncbi:MAG TPA: hypothetical protein VKY81_01005 [Natronosporangium sp.]|nr:hypothetical protein [Natronosporangium sp.]